MTFLTYSFMMVTVFCIIRICDADQTNCGSAVFPRTGLCYQVYTQWRTHSQATQFCNGKGGTLLKLEEDGLWTFIKDELPILSGTAYYIGISDKDNEGTFYWFDGTPVTHDVIVDGRMGDCVLINTDVWHDFPCYLARSYICQYNVTCDSPPDVLNTKKSVSDNNKVYGYNQTVNYTCHQGYHFEPSVYTRTAICGDQVWINFPNNGDCKIRHCSSPPDLSNGETQETVQTHYNAEVKYGCLQGYKMHPLSQTGTHITCEINPSNNMEWSTFAASCIPKSCSGTPTLAHGTTKGATQNTFGSSMTYICDSGYKFSTSVEDLQITCQLKADGSGDVEWSSLTDRCVAKDCSGIPILSNGSPQEAPSKNLGSILTYICDSGYKFSTLVPDLQITCQLKADGSGDVEWSSLTDRCVAKLCSGIPNLANGNPQGPTQNTFGSSVTYICDLGFRFLTSVPNLQVTCELKEGDSGDVEWSTFTDSCVEKPCSGIPILSNGTTQGATPNTFGSNLTYICDPGLRFSTLIPDLQITCQLKDDDSGDVEWSLFTDSCVEKPCSGFPTLANGRTQGATPNTFGSNLTYICDAGFRFSTLILDLQITCQLKADNSEDVEWSLFSDSCVECLDGRYGVNCVEFCGNCSNPICNKATGDCDSQGCQAGYNGTRCENQCSDGFYGDCTQSCGQCQNEICHKMTGFCPQKGCKEGWEGNKCDQKKNSPMPMIGGVVGGLLVIIIIVLVFVVLVIRRRKRSKKEDDGTVNGRNNLTTISPTGTNLYANMEETSKSLKGAHALEMSPAKNKSKHDKNLILKPEKPATAPKPVVPSTSRGKEDIYENLSKRLKVEEIAGYVKDMKATEDGFENEFKTIPSEKLAEWKVGSNPALKLKNRFKNVWPYDHSRVHLKETPGVQGSDYINACHINGYKSPRKYIATQGPMDRTVGDFWRMIWEQNVTRIVMLANIFEDTRKKCEQYWPDYGQTETKGKFTINNAKEENFKGFVVRTMKLSMEQDSSGSEAIYNNDIHTTRTVIQFHFTDWPDKGVPMYCTALVSFHRKVKTMSEKVNSPIVVHCSAGIGRTGTYIALDNLTDQCHAEGVVDVFQCVVDLRKDRYSMVQTKDQYIFLYETLFESLTTGVTLIPCYKFTETYKQLQTLEKGKTITGLDAQYKILKAHIQKVLKERSLEGALDPENENKNRSQEALPGDDVRVYVMLDEPGRNRYINAVFAENYFRRNGLHLTQLPLAETVIDFWRMVQGYNVNTIVSLSNPQDEAFKTSKFWPAGTADKVITGPFTITRKDMSQQGTVECCHLVLAHKNEERNIFLVSVSNWADDKWMPRDINTMYDIYDNVQTWQQGHSSEGQTVVQCYDGGMKSGMYAVVSWMFDMINSEQEVDIFQITKQILLARPGFLTKMDQYKDLYKLAQDYMDKFQNYSNFK